ncbi:hypothetical protein ACFQWB_02755 [Paenibacillus thermoaerophilus]|uniref:Uncharacterized protein n=1 Tax=Paenibacillus thermoaerophilus TaxID=1215385 RepID=A0ABW2V261_9BACL|nr:hypothetical protein [Paenibacillus thermoaerophilus]TMV17761.1 hypothetical protein FE781_06440 [Paenibacillus thermoaerophilus]
MNPLYHSYHSSYELTVCKSAGGYMLQFESYRQPGAPISLHEFAREEDAAAAAKRFPELYQQAELQGYTLKGPFFVHSTGKSVHVSFVFEPGMTLNRFRELL